MPYTQYTLGSLVSQIASLLDDASSVYWTTDEITFAIWEALRVWGALTNYWRARGAFSAASNTAFYDLSVQLPLVRPRNYPFGQVVSEIQFMLLENPGGIAGGGMSGQVSIASILASLQRARNRFVLDTHLPLSISTILTSPPPDGMVAFSQSSVYVHRASWQDVPSVVWHNLWREDAWSADKSNPLWNTSPGFPLTYSESENSPLRLQLIPPPVNSGNLEIISVDSVKIDTTNALASFAVPDEWVHGIKYAAVSELFTAENKLADPMRAQYAEMRYQQAVDAARNAKSILRLMVNGNPVPIDSLAALDAGLPYWRNQPGLPYVGGVLYDMLALAPVPDALYGLSVDVVQSAPIPHGAIAPTNQVQVGPEDIPHIIDYVLHALSFKLGGNEFKSTWPKYDSFMKAVEGRGQINKAKIRYLSALDGQPDKEQAERPDMLVESSRAEGVARS